MGFYAEPWLREARERIKSFPDEARGNLAPDDFDQLPEAVGRAIMAALIEKHGSLPREHDHSKLISMCQTTGVWDVLPPALKGLLTEVESHRSTKDLVPEPTSEEASSQELRRHFFIVRRLIDYIEFHVIRNDFVLKRLKVA
jgi:hypothetical protein